ncbi:hypothetical protein [Halobacterium sp. KA-6]|uniref:hypothetical protein n=1 Tax=Halobacterium sp. KA-6 TaxID=2896368 RepID=UPI001E4F4346|nr:hypothetical protein [Halobacterium sp. KA-6]MCD2203503.1 hypothetical protein [Halobacterium sp. KA-6]
MPTWSRRRALQALGTAAAATLAGCSGEESSGFEEPATRRRGEPVTDYSLHTVRQSSVEPLFWRGERSTRTERRPGGHIYVSDEDDLDDVSFADSDTAAELRAFVQETDYDSESVLVQSRAIQQCYDLRLRGVWREDDGLQTSFCSSLRPADAACSRDAEETVGVGIRLPFSGEDFSSFGSRWSKSCDERPAPVTADDSRGGGV